MQTNANKKAQAALEYMSVIGFSLLILAGVVVFAYNYTLAARESSGVATASTAVNNIVESANLVYAQGYPAKVTIIVNVPQNVQNITFTNNVVKMRIQVKGGFTEIGASARVNLTGSIPASPGFYKVQIQALSGQVNVTKID